MKKVVSFILVLVLALAFSVSLVACNKTVKLTQDQLDSYAEWIKQGYLKGKYVVAADFDMPVKGEYEGAEVSIAWTVDGGNGLASVVAKDDQWATIKINKYADEDTTFTLTGTLSYKGMTASVSKELTIEKYVIADWAFWAENTSKVTMNIKGVIVAKYPYNEEKGNTGVFLQDLDGVHGYFAYQLKVNSQEAYDTDLAIGNVIEVNGTTSLYNGFREMAAGCTYSLVKNEDGSVATATPAKIAIDDIVLTAASLDGALDPMQGVIATLTGWKVKKLEWNTNTAATFEEKGAGSVYVYLTKNDKEFKLYLSTSNQNTLADLKEAVGKLAQGYTVNVEGPIAWYNAPQIYPLASGITVTSTEVTAADKLATELAAIGFDANVKEAKSIDLAAKGATYEDVLFRWTVDSEGVAEIADGKLNITPIEGEVKVITLNLVATCGSETASKSFDIVVGDPAVLTPAQIVTMAYALNVGKQLGFSVSLTGVITDIKDGYYNKKYNSVTFTMEVEGKSIGVFSVTVDDGVDATGLKAGDTATVSGSIIRYNETTVQFAYNTKPVGAVKSFTRTERTDADKVAEELAALSLPGLVSESTELDLAQAGKNYSEVKLAWEVLGETNAASIADGKLTLTVGTAIETVQIKVTASISDDSGVLASDDKTFTVQLGNTDALTPAQIVAMAYALEKDKSMGFEVTLTGVISKIVTAYSAQHGNITVNLIIDGDEDHIIQAFRLKGEGDNNVATLGEGDTVTVKGIIKNFKGTVEFDAGCLAIAIERFERTDAQKIEEELAGLSLPSAVTESKSLDLAQAGTNYTDVKFAWEIVGETDAASIADGKLNLTVGDSNETVTVKVTATIGEGEAAASASKEFEISLGDGISSWQSWNDKNAQKVQMTIKGVVVAKYLYSASNKNTSVYLQDLDGVHGYFAYQLAVESEDAYNNDLAIGNVITVSGTTSLYVSANFREMGAGCTYEVVKNADGSVAVSPIALINFDEVIAASADGSTAALDPYQGVKGTFTEWVVSKVTEVPDRNNADRKHYDFTLTKGDNTLSVQFDTKYQSTAADVDAILQKLAVGYTVNVTAALAWNNGPQVYPQVNDVVVTSTEISISDEDKIKTEKEDLNVTTWFFASTTEPIELATKGETHKDVEIIWALEGDSAFSLRENKLSVTIGEANATATLTATLKSGEVEDTKAFELQAIVDAATMTPAEIMAYLGTLPKDETTSLEFMLTGTVTEEDFENSDRFSNVTGMLDLGDPGKIKFYRITVAAGIDQKDIQPGRVITIKGPVKNYNGTIQFVDPAKVTGIEPTDAELLAADLDALSVIEMTDTAEPIILPTEGEFGSAFAWTLTNKPEGNECALNGNELTIVIGEEDATLTLLVNATLGEESDSKEFTIVVRATAISAAEKVAAELEALELDELVFEEAASIDLPANGTTYEDVVITWAITEGTIATVEDGKLNVTIGAETATATLTATLTVGEEELTDNTKSFTVTAKVPSETELLLRSLYALESGANQNDVTLTGVVSEITSAWSDSFGNITFNFVVDDLTDYPMLAYRVSGTNAKYLVVGDTVTVNGTVTNWNGTIEFKQGSKVTAIVFTGEHSEADMVALEKEALSITTEYTEDINEVPLPSVGSLFEEDVTISWALAEESEDISLEDNVLLAFIVEETYSFDVVATIAVGETTDTKSFTITMIGSASARINAAKEALTLAQVNFTESTTEPIVLPVEDEPNGVTITWSLGESDVFALADGNKLSVVIADGTNATVTLTAWLTCGSVLDSKEFTLTAKDTSAEQGGGEETEKPVTVSITFSEKYSENTILTDVNIPLGDEITVCFSQPSGSAPQYYTNGSSVRWYAKGVLTIGASNSYVITSITITFGASDGTNAITANVGEWDGATWTGSANQVVLTQDGTKGNRRIASIAVTYEKASA